MLLNFEQEMINFITFSSSPSEDKNLFTKLKQITISSFFEPEEKGEVYLLHQVFQAQTLNPSLRLVQCVSRI